MMGGVGVNGNQRWEGMAGRGWEDRFVRHRLPMSSYYTVECEGLPSLFDTRWEPPRAEPAVVNNGGCNVAPDSEGPSGWLGRRFSTRYEFISLLLPSAVLKSGGKPPHSKGPPAIARSFPVRATGLVCAAACDEVVYNNAPLTDGLKTIVPPGATCVRQGSGQEAFANPIMSQRPVCRKRLATTPTAMSLAKSSAIVPGRAPTGSKQRLSPVRTRIGIHRKSTLKPFCSTTVWPKSKSLSFPFSCLERLSPAHGGS